MNDFRPDNRPRQSPPRRFLSLALTIGVHIGLLAFLLVGINWQSAPSGSLEVGLVGAPSASAPAPPPPPEPPKPEPKIEEPPKPEPPKEQPKPEIATKKSEPKKTEPKKPPKPEKKPEPKPKPKPEPKPKPKPPEAPLKPIDLLDKKLDQAIERHAEAKKVSDILGDGQQGQNRQAGAGGGSPGELDAYRNAIASKVRRNLATPPGISGNPSAVFEIEQVLGSRGGEVVNVKLKQSSGNKALDEAIERAIRKSDPLPPPDNPALFRRRLEVTFRPLEE
ncbi:MAG: TonB C-terminal domain-containing protein [Azoarcus sp.]|jgi:colicin import membrane protein|nr:TonB C-terminal domain-containing protein [Azoarcus sp.]